MSKYRSAILSGIDAFEQLKEEFILPMIAEPLLDIHQKKEMEMESLIDSGKIGSPEDLLTRFVFPNAK